MTWAWYMSFLYVYFEGAETTNNLEEVSVPDSHEESYEGVESPAPKKKQRKNYDLTQKF